MSGGSENTRYFISGAAKRDGAIINNTFNERQSLRVNLDQTLSSRWSLSVNTAFNRNQTDKGFTNNDNNGASITYALAYVPAFMPMEPVNGAYPQPAVTYLGSNPLQTADLGHNDEVVVRFSAGATLTGRARQH